MDWTVLAVINLKTLIIRSVLRDYSDAYIYIYICLSGTITVTEVAAGGVITVCKEYFKNLHLLIE